MMDFGVKFCRGPKVMPTGFSQEAGQVLINIHTLSDTALCKFLLSLVKLKKYWVIKSG
jgi:hypothetical protein